jgi:hypothetical protein
MYLVRQKWKRIRQTYGLTTRNSKTPRKHDAGEFLLMDLASSNKRPLALEAGLPRLSQSERRRHANGSEVDF